MQVPGLASEAPRICWGGIGRGTTLSFRRSTGLADSADGLGGGSSPESLLEIMKESGIGSYGALALILASALKISSLAGLANIDPTLPGSALIAGHALSRLFPTWLLRLLPYARQQGGGKAPAAAPPPPAAPC